MMVKSLGKFYKEDEAFYVCVLSFRWWEHKEKWCGLIEWVDER